jgi:hypothetical protein
VKNKTWTSPLVNDYEFQIISGLWSSNLSFVISKRGIPIVDDKGFILSSAVLIFWICKLTNKNSALFEGVF